MSSFSFPHLSTPLLFSLPSSVSDPICGASRARPPTSPRGPASSSPRPPEPLPGPSRARPAGEQARRERRRPPTSNRIEDWESVRFVSLGDLDNWIGLLFSF
ncbi:hypothetical protein DAI22_06g215903 [Oryza sativa Japonica Group]|nr:hypothetical protein DAI22_06g215903 [Oryza sativa Japonica Group]